MEIKKANIEDREILFEIENEVFSEESKNSFFDSFLKDSINYYLCKDREEVVGYIAVNILIGEGEILSIAVKKSKRKLGAGSLLLKYALEKLEESGAKKVFLEVRKSNATAQKLYEKFGFSLISTRKEYYKNKDGTREDALIFCKSL